MYILLEQDDLFISTGASSFWAAPELRIPDSLWDYLPRKLLPLHAKY